MLNIAVINPACELPAILRTIFANSDANSIADQYINRIVKDALAESTET